MNIEIEEIQKTEKEIAELKDEKLMMLERIVSDELIKREAKRMILQLLDRQKQTR